MRNHGSFSGTPKTEWLVDDAGKDRDMKLLEDFSFKDPAGRIWPAPAGSIVNGASIPRPLWVTVGSPYTDDYRRASIVHDVACNTPSVSRREADVMFYHACIAGGCPKSQAKILYAGVRAGAWAIRALAPRALDRIRHRFRVPFDRGTDERFIQGKFQDIATALISIPDDAPISEMDAVIEEYINF